MPERPMPVNRPKVPNADIISNRSIYNKNNIVMGRQFAGTIHFAPLSVLAYVKMVKIRVKLMLHNKETLKKKLVSS